MPANLTQGPKVNYDARVGAGLGRGPNSKKKLLTGAAWSQTWPAPGSTLDLDFANNRGFVRGYGQGGVMDAVTFTRASNGTYVGPDGLLAGSGGPQGALGLNLLTFPQDFENAAWAKSAASIQANVIAAPDGTATADKLVEDATNANHDVISAAVNLVSGTVYTFSAYAFAGERTWLRLTVPSAGFGSFFTTWFNLAAGTVGTIQSGTASISSVGAGWYRCSVTLTATATGSGAFYLRLATSDGGTTYQGNGTSGIFIWGAQLEVGSSATTYYPTNYGTWRQDWASTAVVAGNTFTFSQDFENGAWPKVLGAVITANVATAPDGTNTADRFDRGGTATTSRILQNQSVVLGTNYTTSIYAKAETATNLTIETGLINSFSTTTFNLSNGTVTGQAGATITAVGNGWYRCVLPFIAAGTGTHEIRFGSYGATTGALLIWGAQFELGSSATTYQAIAQPTTNTPLAANSTCNGILIEESRTNRLLWCRDGTQSNWTKTNVTAAKNQTGVDGVANAATSLTASADGGTCIQTITLASGSRTCSVYLKRITGTGTVQVSLDGTTWSTVDLSSTAWRRVVMSGTVTNPVLGIKLATNGDAVAMDYAQVEDGAFVTSPILTTTATATRAVDAATITGSRLSGFLNPGEGTITSTSIGLRNGIIASLYQGSGATINMYQDYQGSNLRYFTSNVNIGSAGSLGSLNAISSSYKRDSAFSAVNGQAPLTGASTLQFGPTTLQIGSITASVTSVLNGWVQRLIYHPKMLGAGNVQAFSGAGR